MAKSKNSTNKNQISKAHRQGIKKPRENKHISSKGVNARFLRNRRRAVKNDPSIKKQANLAKRVAKKDE